MQKNVVFLQISHRVTAPVNPVLEYYTQVYAQHEGFEIASPDFMELPTWIAIASGMLGDNYTQILHVVTDVQDTIEFLNTLPWDTTILASVMDVNVSTIHHIMDKAEPKYWVVGGYIDFDTLVNDPVWLSTAIVLDDIYSLNHVLLDADVLAEPDYGIFGTMKTIPRLILSDGCLHNCAFCTIEQEIVEWSDSAVMAQVESFKSMNFSLVYISDKTFGQATNMDILERVAERIWEFNDDFMGFIVQTTVQEARKNAKHWIENLNVMYIEVGVEHVDAEYLKRMRKPYNLGMLSELTSYLRSDYRGLVGFIPNLMFALPDADYTNTIEWVKDNRDIISFVNPFILCQYAQSKGTMIDDASGSHDQDENSLDKSWLTEAQVEENKVVMSTMFSLTGGG